ncbi:ribonucleoprotein [Vigna angularis]|uniref:Ribonucleoprotein n=1 Tax=Phaseolus angularis TaxID=3914 RepID=A0A8T0KUD8_PHAAN|nr:ribonucleoprotein [Vigna angularis]
MAASSLIFNSSLSFNFSHTVISFKPQNFEPQFSISSAISLCHLPLSLVSFQDTQNPIQDETLQKTEPNASLFNHSARLFVGNLPYSLPSSQLAQRFGEAGNVVSVEIVYDDITDRSRGFAFVTMGSVEEAECAIRMFDGSNSCDGNGCDDEQEIGGRIIKVNVAEIPRKGKWRVMGSNYRGFVDSPHKIYAGNLGWGVTSQCLRDAFVELPGFLSAKVIYERNSGKSQGYGFVSFRTAEHVEAALNSMNGVGQHLRCSFFQASSVDKDKNHLDDNHPYRQKQAYLEHPCSCLQIYRTFKAALHSEMAKLSWLAFGAEDVEAFGKERIKDLGWILMVVGVLYGVIFGWL